MEDYYLPIKFNIAFVGYNKQLSYKGLQQFIDNNIEQVKNIQKSSYDFKVYLKDDTVITAISFDTTARGYKFDQYILFDDNRWSIESEKAEEIRLLIAYTSLYKVPEEFQILKYENKQPTKEYLKLICDDEDETFTGYVYYSCPCGKFFGHREHVPKDMICPKCNSNLKF